MRADVPERTPWIVFNAPDAKAVFLGELKVGVSSGG